MNNVASIISKLCCCCTSFKSSCCEKRVDTSTNANGDQTTHLHKELGSIEYYKSPSSFSIQCGNKWCCFFKFVRGNPNEAQTQVHPIITE